MRRRGASYGGAPIAWLGDALIGAQALLFTSANEPDVLPAYRSAINVAPAGAFAAGSRSLSQRLRTMGDEIREDFRTGFNPGSPAATPVPPPPPSPQAVATSGRGAQQGIWIGMILIVLGAYFLLDNLGVFNAVRWDLFWPVVLIAVGLLFLVRRR